MRKTLFILLNILTLGFAFLGLIEYVKACDKVARGK